MQRMVKEGVLKNVGDWDGRLMAMKRSQIAAVPYGGWFAGNISSSLPDQKENGKSCHCLLWKRVVCVR